jgi:hypothetical protein
MAVRTKMVGLRLPTRLNDRVEAFMYSNDLTFTEALTTVLERGFESIDPSANSDIEKVDYQEQIDRLSDDLNRLTETVDDLLSKQERSTPKPRKKKVVEESISLNSVDEDIYEETVREEPQLSSLNDEEFSKLSGHSVNILEYCKRRPEYSTGRELIEGYRFDSLSDKWVKVDS